jgi:hypothetical protein
VKSVFFQKDKNKKKKRVFDGFYMGHGLTQVFSLGQVGSIISLFFLKPKPLLLTYQFN